MKKLILTFRGYDNWARPVYIAENGRYYVDTDNREDRLPNICSKYRNLYYGEPDIPVHDDVDVEFVPFRITWQRDSVECEGEISMSPNTTPWGKPESCRTLCPGVFQVATAGHGGIMVDRKVTDIYLSPSARKIGFCDGAYLCFEEDCDAPVALRELMDKEAITSNQDEVIDASIRRNHPDYWAARERRIR